MAAILEGLPLSLAQAQPGFVDESGRLQRPTRSEVAEALARERFEFRVDQRCECIRGPLLALRDTRESSSDRRVASVSKFSIHRPASMPSEESPGKGRSLARWRG